MKNVAEFATLEDHLAPAEWEYINKVLDETGDDKAATSIVLGVSVATLYRRIGVLQAKFGKRSQVLKRGREAKSESEKSAEKSVAEEAVERAGGDKIAAAKALGVSLPTLYRHLKGGAKNK